jgi:ATP-dependent DNA helicase RecQ
LEEQEKVFHIKELNEQAEEKGLSDISTNKIKTIFNFWSIKNWIKRQRLESKNHIAVISLHAKEVLKSKLEKRHALAKFIIEYLYEKSIKNPSEDDDTKRTY